MEREEVGIGTKKESLQPKEVVVEDFVIEMQKNKNQEAIGEKVTLICLYPGRSKPLEISKVQFVKDRKIEVSGLWYKVDDDKQIPYSSALAHFLRWNKCENLKEVKGKSIGTTTDAAGFLIVRAY